MPPRRYLPERTIQTGIGPVAVRCPRVRDRGAGEVGPRIRFTSAILPPYLRRARSIEELLPWLYRFLPRIYETRSSQLHYLAFFGPVALTIIIN